MKLASLEIQNFRSCENVDVPFNDYTCLVGPNGAGKSNVLCALNIFFRQSENVASDLSRLVAEDFHNKNTTVPIKITATFVDLEPDAQKDFADYFRHDKLVVSTIARFDDSAQCAEVLQYGERMAMPAFAKFFEADASGAKVQDLKNIYANFRATYTDLPAASSKDSMIEALRAYEAAHEELCELIPSKDEFYGFTKGANRLAKYVQWVYVPAVKDATSEQRESRNTALGKLLARTVRLKVKFDERLKEIRQRAQGAYETLLKENQGALDEVSASLGTRLAEWAHPKASLRIEWRNDPEKSVQVDNPFAQIVAGEDAFEGELARFGHGLQRSYLFALLQELATLPDGSEPRLILACEEPELYQHPPQARHLAEVFRKLAQTNSQVMVCTHSPYFVSGEAFEDIRMVRKCGLSMTTTIKHVAYADLLEEWREALGEEPKRTQGILAKIHQELQTRLNEMFFTSRLVLVEGLEDIAYITAYLSLGGKWDEYRRSGCHLVPTGGKSHMIPALLIARRLGIPTFIVFDSDGDKSDKNGSRSRHERDNRALLKLAGVADPEPFPASTLWGQNVVMWHSRIGDIVEVEIGADSWNGLRQAVEAEFGHIGGLEKNSLCVAAVISRAWDGGKRSQSLEQLCNEILAFGASE